MKAALNTAATLAFADVYLGCKIIQCDAFSIMDFNVFHNFPGTEFIGGENCCVPGLFRGERKLSEKFTPELTDTCFGCQFIAPFLILI